MRLIISILSHLRENQFSAIFAPALMLVKTSRNCHYYVGLKFSSTKRRITKGRMMEKASKQKGLLTSSISDLYYSMII